VRAAPLAHIDTDTEVMLVWFRAGHPAAPVPNALGADLKSGNRDMQPQAVSAKPAEPPAKPATAAPAPPAGAPPAATAAAKPGGEP
jgi:2-oxoglutarate dehydrogenase E1 component